MNKNCIRVAPLLFTISVILFLDLVINYNVFPLTEGWWETYAWLHGLGYNIYEKYGFPFPPLFVYLIGSILKISKEIIFERNIFAAIHVIEVVMVWVWLRKFVDSISAALGALISSILLISSPTYIPKDYHMVVSIEVIGLLIAYYKKTSLLDMLLVGIVLASTILTKQNIAIFFAAPVAIVIASRQILGKNLIDIFISIIVFSIGAFAIFGLIYNEFGISWIGSYFGNDSKGQPIVILLRFLLDNETRTILIISILICFAVPITTKIINYLNLKELSATGIRNVMIIMLSIMAIKDPRILYSLVIAWPVLRFQGDTKKQSNNVEILKFAFPLYLLVYCNTNTAGFNATGLELLIALFTAEITYEMARYFKYRIYIIIFVIASFLVAAKILKNVSYDWWGYKVSGILSKQNNYIEDGILNGIRLDDFAYNAVNKLYGLKSTNILTHDTFLISSPNIPIVYYLLGIVPQIPPVLWFDVISKAEGYSALDYIEKHQPNIIVNLFVPKFVFDAHLIMKHDDLALFDIQNQIYTLFANLSYKTIYKDIPQPYDEFNAKVDEKVFSVLKPNNIRSVCTNSKVQCSLLNDKYIFGAGDMETFTVANSNSLKKIVRHSDRLLQNLSEYNLVIGILK